MSVLKKQKICSDKIIKRQNEKQTHIIINNTKSKLSNKYTISSAPYPFNAKQYNWSIEKVIGPEWVTQNTFKKNIRPDISINMGTIIKPMQK